MNRKTKSGKREQNSKAVTAIVALRKWKRYGALFIFLFSFLLYANTIPNGYTNDDVFVTGQNELVRQGIKAIPEIITSPYMMVKDKGSDYRPVPKIIYAVQSEFFGANPHVSHFIQAVVYALSCSFLFIFLSYLFSSVNLLLPLTATLLFSAHPIHSEVVAGLKNMDELMSFFFSCLILFLYIRWYREGKRMYFILALLLIPFAVYSKASSVVLMFWLPLLLWYEQPSAKRWKRIAATTVTAIVILFLLWISEKFIIVQHVSDEASRKVQFLENPISDSKNIALIVGVALRSLWFYLHKLVYPYPLGWFYGYNTIPLEKPWMPLPLLSFFIYAGLFVFVIYGWKKYRILSLSILLYLTSITPFSNIAGAVPGIVGERIAYFASLGFCLAVAYILLKASGTDIQKSTPKLKLSLAAPVTVILIFYSTIIISRNSDYKDNLTLYANDIKFLDKSFLAHHAYAMQLQLDYQAAGASPDKRWMIEKALEEYEKANKMYDKSFEGQMRVGEILSASFNKPAEALPYFIRATEIDSSSSQAFFGMAFCYSLLNKNDSAISYYKKSIRLDSNNLTAWENLSVTFSRMKMNDSAIVYNRRLLEQNSHSENGNANAGFFYKNMGKTDSAKYYFQKALTINPNRNDVKEALKEITLSTR